MKSRLKALLFFSARERRGILLLTLGVIAVLMWGYGYLHRKSGQTPVNADSLARQEYEAFASHIARQESAWQARYAPTYKRWEREPELAPFDPNTADSATFCRLGLPGWMARNILRYRAKGGKFRRPDDFKKIYGLTDAQYRQLLPYIDIPPEDTLRQTARLYNPPAMRDTVLYPNKFPEGTVIELNGADTTLLKKIPGIGSGIARMITGYRQRLGGFYRIEQLEDIHLDYRQLAPWFSIDTAGIRRIDLNRASVDRLRNHPYINFYQAKAIVEYRRKHGRLKSLKPFVLYEEFSAEDLERIGHYVCFGE